MSEPELFANIRVKMDLPTFQAISSLSITAFRMTLEALAKEHGDKAGEWLDQLEADILFEAKGVIASGTDIHTEAESIGSGIQVLEAIIGAVRTSLIRKNQ